MTPTPRNAREALIEGLCDAAGFVLGGLAGWAVGFWLGLSIEAEWGPRSIGAVVLIALGCGLGKKLSQRWMAAFIKR